MIISGTECSVLRTFPFYCYPNCGAPVTKVQTHHTSAACSKTRNLCAILSSPPPSTAIPILLSALWIQQILNGVLWHVTQKSGICPRLGVFHAYQCCHTWQDFFTKSRWYSIVQILRICLLTDWRTRGDSIAWRVKSCCNNLACRHPRNIDLKQAG